MKKQAGMWIVVSVLVIALGIVYALATSPSSKPETSQIAASPSHGHPHPTAQVAGTQKADVSLSPDMTKVDAYQFLDPVPVGKKAPDFTTKTVDGKSIHLADFIGKKNLVLVFYQGSFCSVCAAQLSNLQSHLADFKAQDAEIIAISADDQRHAMMSVGENGLSFNVIPDPDKQLIQKFGVANISKQNIAWPSLFVLDKQGVVQLSYADAHGHRLHSNEILPVLSKITGKPAPRLSYDQ